MGFGQNEMVVIQILSGSIADNLGIKLGDVIVKLDDQFIYSNDNWYRFRKKQNSDAKLLVKRNHFYYDFILPPQSSGMKADFKMNLSLRIKSTNVRAHNRIVLDQLKVGLSLNDVKNLFGYGEVKTSDKGIITNPYRTGTFKDKSGNEFIILFYYTDNKGKSIKNVINDQDLTPLVFQDNKLIGWGWTFIEDDLNKFELRFRWNILL